MVRFIIRRVLTGAAVLLVSTFIMYGLVSISIDPFFDLRGVQAPNVEQLFEQRRQLLNLDTPWYLRYWEWLTNLLQGDMGTSWRSNRDVEGMLGDAIISTFQLVTASTFLAIVIGVAIGIVSALRQYTTFDYLITFVSFVLFSLPSFWVAVLLKQVGAIEFNNFLQDPYFSWTTITVVGVIAGLLWMLAVGGDLRRRVIVGIAGFAATFGMLAYLQISGWWSQPHLSGGLLLVISLATGLAVVVLLTGLSNRRALYAMLTVVAVGMIVKPWLTGTVLNGAFWAPPAADGSGNSATTLFVVLLLLLLAAAVVGALIGVAWRGPDWRQSARVAGVTAALMMIYIIVDRAMSAWPAYVGSNAINGRPIATTGGSTPNLGGNFWIQLLDTYTHLLLPTMALTLISFAGYTRYSRSSMLEVMNQDYIRTARAKGLTERAVVMKHGFRNSLIPLATIVPVDVVTLIGGAIITETIFGRPGMGQLFISSLREADMNPLMGYIVITAALAVLANLISDLVYASLDPRIRVN